MSAWFDIEENHYNELLRLAAVYHREAVRCRDARAYIGGCTMAGAALEAVLLAMLHLYGSEVEADHTIPIPRSKGRPKDLLKWTLPEMLRAAAAMGWLPRALPDDAEWNTRLAQIGDYAEALRQTRNLVHPARYLQDHSPSRVTKKYLVLSIEVFEAASAHLEAKVHTSIRRTLNAEDQNIP